ncbi:MAG: hypothetical protein II597_03885, partial [Prevotella sp.]|nr:hypothetical protein [Prevotella sp.]
SLSFYAHKTTYEKPIEARWDIQTSCLCGINMVFITNKQGVYEVSCFLPPTFLLSINKVKRRLLKNT